MSTGTRSLLYTVFTRHLWSSVSFYKVVVEGHIRVVSNALMSVISRWKQQSCSALVGKGGGTETVKNIKTQSFELPLYVFLSFHFFCLFFFSRST